MDRAFNLPACGWTAGLAAKVRRATEFDNLAGAVFDDFVALDDVGVFQSHLTAGFESEILWRWHFHEVILLNVEFTGERNFSRASGLILRIVDRVKLFGLALGNVG